MIRPGHFGMTLAFILNFVRDCIASTRIQPIKDCYPGKSEANWPAVQTAWSSIFGRISREYIKHGLAFNTIWVAVILVRRVAWGYWESPGIMRRQSVASNNAESGWSGTNFHRSF